MLVVAFDVNETLLDLAALDGPFLDLLGSAALRGQWFGQMLQLAFVGGLTGSYVDVTTAQRAALLMVAERAGRALTSGDIDELVDRMTRLLAHPDVDRALAALTGAGVTAVALPNSTRPVAQAQLEYAGLGGYFDQVMSADDVRCLTPAPEPYRAVAAAYDVPPSDVRLVAAHSWDVFGALAAGCRAGFVARPGAVLSPLGAQPDIVGADVGDVVEQILAAGIGRLTLRDRRNPATEGCLVSRRRLGLHLRLVPAAAPAITRPAAAASGGPPAPACGRRRAAAPRPRSGRQSCPRRPAPAARPAAGRPRAAGRPARLPGSSTTAPLEQPPSGASSPSAHQPPLHASPSTTPTPGRAGVSRASRSMAVSASSGRLVWATGWLDR